MIAYHPVYPGDDGSPLKKDINETDCLELAYGQNTFSLDVASINYDYPSNILYSWKIDGYHKSGPVRVKIIGLLLEICLLAVIRYKFVLYLMRRSIKLMKQGVFRSLLPLRCGPVCGQWWGMQFWWS